MKKRIRFWMAVLAALALCQTTAYAGSVELDQRVKEAGRVINEIMQAPEYSIPEELLAKCKAIAIYPSVLKGGFIIGAQYGRGIVLSKDKSGNWGAPAFSTIGGGSLGWQIGGQATDVILVIMNDGGLNGLLNSNFKLGADVSVAAGPIGRKAEASTDLSLQAGILSYSRSRGLFAGIALDGSVMTEDNDSNTIYYGRDVTSREILQGGKVKPQESSKELISSLDEYSSRWIKEKE